MRNWVVVWMAAVHMSLTGPSLSFLQDSNTHTVSSRLIRQCLAPLSTLLPMPVFTSPREKGRETGIGGWREKGRAHRRGRGRREMRVARQRTGHMTNSQSSVYKPKRERERDPCIELREAEAEI